MGEGSYRNSVQTKGTKIPISKQSSQVFDVISTCSHMMSQLDFDFTVYLSQQMKAFSKLEKKDLKLGGQQKSKKMKTLRLRFQLIR